MGRPKKNVTPAKETTPKAKAKEPAKEPEEETENLSLTLTRSRRIPKPNPKYSNDVIVPYSSRVTGDSSSRSTSPAHSSTSDEVVPASEDDDEEEVEAPKPGTRKRGRPPKKQAPEPPAKKATPPAPQAKETKVVEKKEQKGVPVKRTPERLGKQALLLDAAAKRKRDDELISANVQSDVKKQVKALQKELKTISQPKPEAQARPGDKKAPGTKIVTQVKGEYIDVEGTAENVKIVDVSEILSKKHELNEPKRLRKCPPEVNQKIPPRTPYGSKNITQSPKVGTQTPKVLTQAPTKMIAPSAKLAPKVSPVTTRISPKISPKSTPPPLVTRQLNNGKMNSVNRLMNARKSLASVTKGPVIDLTESGTNSLEKPKKALKEALVASTVVQKRPQPIPLRPVGAVQKGLGMPIKISPERRPPPLVTRPPPLITRSTLPTKSQVTGTRVKKEVTSVEMWNVVHLPKESPEEHPKITLGMSLKELTEKVKDIQLPSEAWSHNIKGSTEPSKNIAFKLAKPEEPTKERSVTFSTKELIIEIEGNEVVFIGAPDNLTTASDIETLLEIVNDVSMKNSCVETVAVVL